MNTRKYTLNDFIEHARRVHGNKYDYSKVDYKGTHIKVCIICPEHGEFWQTPKLHLRGCGCPKCGNDKIKKKLKLTQEKVIKRFIEIHGNKYDYSKVEYNGMHVKICVICPEHGEFWITPSSHLKGHGCSKCSGKYIDRDLFIKKGDAIHNGTYIYLKVHNFKKNTEKVTIICPIHGEFEQRVNDHLNGCGCPKCGLERRIESRKNNPYDVIEKFIKIHGERYDYSLVPQYYKNSNTKVPIICPKHGIFWQTSSNHMQCGCPLCNQSRGEEQIMIYLNKHQISFASQKTFDWLKYKRKQKLDFYLNDYNIGIEYQGMQHYIPVTFGKITKKKANKNFELIQDKDKNKKMLCEKYGIKLYYIKYTDDIEKRLDEILSELNNVKNLVN